MGRLGDVMSLACAMMQAFVLALTLSADGFIVSVSYGCQKIKIPFSSAMVINVVCSAILGVSLLLGSVVRPYLSPNASTMISFTILFVMGFIRLLDDITKSIIRKNSNLSKKIHFSMFNLKFILSVYADPEKVDVDRSQSISHLEACSLAIALSFDGIAVGFGAALGEVNGFALIFASLLTNAAALMLGAAIGNRVSEKSQNNISWISGLTLMILAILKIA